MSVSIQHWTIHDLETLPDNGGWERYEIINGELHLTRAPHFRHQSAITPLLPGFSVAIAQVFP